MALLDYSQLSLADTVLSQRKQKRTFTPSPRKPKGKKAYGLVEGGAEKKMEITR